ncbi:50S ribosomal protein L21 [Spirochaetia bacterium 38H-sp]|uniref:Large ribosomal subunit protein bL21 n=1 Tax=Rarispira pelagica TaxID=3141764 RepID=A0ABU9UE06_9SPIR
MYALVEIAGKQYKVEEGSKLVVDKLQLEPGASVDFDSVLMLRKDDEVKLGSPYVDGCKVKAVVEDQIKGKKIVVFKYKRRKNYRRKRGHRQQYSVLKVEKIEA